MKIGQNGAFSGCCNPLDVWGIHINAPNFWEMDDNFNANYQGGMASYELLEPGRTGSYGEPAGQTIKPELWDRDVYKSLPWYLYAVKIPSSYPYGCNRSDVQHSGNAAEGGDGTWQVQLGICAEHHQFITGGTPDDVENTIPQWRFCFGSRAVYLDGVQTHVAYRLSSSIINNANDRNHAIGIEIGEIVVCNIAGQTASVYPVQRPSFTPPVTTMEDTLYTYMRSHFVDRFVLGGLGGLGAQISAQSIGMGQEYCVFSSYNPNATAWTVGRAKFNGTRLGDPGIEVRYSPTDVGTGNEGEWKVVLPAIRTYKDSSAPAPDEPYVVVMNGANEIIKTCLWQTDVWRSGYSGDPEQNAMIDGTVHDDEADAGTTIIDTTDEADQALIDFPDETWNNLKIRCYNRVYDPTTGHSTDLVLFTTNDDPVDETGLVADFEGDLNTGMPSGLAWETGGTQEFDFWAASTDKHSLNSYSAKTQWQDVTKQAKSEMWITVTLPTAGQLVFDYIHDNRKYGTHEEPWGSLTLLPQVEHTLAIKVDGESVPISIDGHSYTSSIIDNVNTPDPADFGGVSEAFYESFKTATIDLSAGTHRIQLTTVRLYQDNGHVHSCLDNVRFPDLRIGDNVQGLKTWFYAKGKVRQGKYWTYAKQDDEDATALASRVSVTPDFITLDWDGRILIGNPHYMARVVIDEDNNDAIDETFGSYRFSTEGGEKGYVRWTASANIPPEERPCWGSDQGTFVFDNDGNVPAWGCFQILPVTGSRTYQTRGTHGAMRDATTDPLNLEDFTFPHAVNGGNFDTEQFSFLTRSSTNWSQRPSCWTISEDGTELRPHLEIWWRPTHDQPSWPEHPDGAGHWPSPPYMSTFHNAVFGESNGYITYTDVGMARVYDPLQLPAFGDKARWTVYNYVIPRGYSTALTQTPQVVWCQFIDDPPSNPEDPLWYNPDVYGPWLSARWFLLQARFDPCGLRFAWPQFAYGINYATSCPDPENPEEDIYSDTWVTMAGSPSDPWGVRDWWPFTDFDVVDAGGPCHCLKQAAPSIA